MVVSALMGLQQQGLALTDVPPLQFCIIMGAGSPGSAFQVRCLRKTSATTRWLRGPCGCRSAVHHVSSLAPCDRQHFCCSFHFERASAVCASQEWNQKCVYYTSKYEFLALPMEPSIPFSTHWLRLRVMTNAIARSCVAATSMDDDGISVHECCVKLLSLLKNL